MLVQRDQFAGGIPVALSPSGVVRRARAQVAHSTGCAFFGIRRVRHIGGALLALSDTEARSYPRGPQAFAPMPLHLLSFPTIVVALAQTDPQFLSTVHGFRGILGERID